MGGVGGWELGAWGGGVTMSRRAFSLSLKGIDRLPEPLVFHLQSGKWERHKLKVLFFSFQGVGVVHGAHF